MPEHNRPMIAAHAVRMTADARRILGRKGLLGKEPATLLALCAVHEMFGLPPGRPAEPLPNAARTAVVVATNLNNVRTVCTVMAEARESSARSVSPLETPNASGNMTAATIAIWYGFTGPNLTVCDGATAGLAGLRLAMLLLRAKRADSVVLVGVEPADPIASALAALREPRPKPLTAGAGCVLLGTWPDRPDLPYCGPVRRTQQQIPWDDDLAADEPGDLYGAAGVVRLAAAADRLAGGGTSPITVSCGGKEDGYAGVQVFPGGTG